MKCKFLALSMAVLTFLATGCERQSTPPMATRMDAPVAAPPSTETSESPQRYIAESHKIDLIVPASQLQKSWESAAADCGTIRCQVISSHLVGDTSDSTPSGDISLRVAPEDLEKLLASIEKLGKVAQHTMEREDETATVVDTDARIKNLTSFRDNLRSMLARPSATIKDLLEIQQQLTDTQSQLDGETAKRKVLATETEKIAVDVSFSAEAPNERFGAFAEIGNALRQSASTFADSTASLVTAIAAILPWLALILPALWLLVRIWRKLRPHHYRQPSPSALPTPPPPAAS